MWVDLAAPYPAMAFLSHLYSQVSAGNGVAADQLDQELEAFLNRTDAFREFTECMLRERVRDAAAVGRASDALDRLTEAGELAESDLVDRLGVGDSGVGRKWLEWMIESFPLTREEGKVRCASQLFRRWWSHEGL